MKDLNRRIGKLERKIEPHQRLICAVGTPKNLALAKKGLMPDNPSISATYRPARLKGGKKPRLVRRRLGKHDLVVFLTEAEMAL
jgi:hypothetical protein